MVFASGVLPKMAAISSLAVKMPVMVKPRTWGPHVLVDSHAIMRPDHLQRLPHLCHKMANQPSPHSVVSYLLCETLDVQACMFLVRIEIKPVTAVNDLRLNFRLETLYSLDGAARGIVLSERRTCENGAWERSDHPLVLSRSFCRSQKSRFSQGEAPRPCSD